jgi:uncharacterized tellurite resistance protein B-like protein
VLEQIRNLLARAAQPATVESGKTTQGQLLQLAACALLLELAHADGEFSATERLRIEDALRRHFGLEASEVHELMTLAESQRSEAADLYQFTSVVARDYDEGQRMVLAEILWSVVYADGALTSHETYLMRKLGNLLDLRPGYLSEARRRVFPDRPAAG